MITRIQTLKQRGSALIISIVILNVLTLGAMVAMQRSTVQIRMISNLQHQQEISNSTLGTLNYVYNQMESNGKLQSDILTKAQQQYQISLADPTKSDSFDPFSTMASLTQPKFNTKIIKTDGISTAVRNLPVPAGTKFYIKGKGGCGNGCNVVHAAIKTTSISKNDSIKDIQEIGVRRLIPST